MFIKIFGGPIVKPRIKFMDHKTVFFDGIHTNMISLRCGGVKDKHRGKKHAELDTSEG